MKAIFSRFFGAAGLASLGLVLLVATRANASDFHLYFNNVFSASGVTAPAGPGPWIDVLVQDVTPGTVRVTLSDVGLSSGEFVSDIFLNLNTADSPGSLFFSQVATSGNFSSPVISQMANTYKADGDGYYDIDLAFATANDMMQRFDGTDSVTYQITGIAGLTASDFAFTSEEGGGTGTWYAAAHIQGIGSGSVWASPTGITPVPEPATVALLALSAGLCLGRRFKN
jgi:hypothetical protein